MQIKSIVAIALASVVAAQSSAPPPATSPSASSSSSAPPPAPTNSALVDCFIKNNCGTNVNCQAGCAGVPNPSANQVNQITNCVAQCNNTLPIAQYTACQSQCIAPMITNQTVPSASASGSKNGTASGGNSSGTASAHMAASALGAITLFAMYITL